MFKFGGSHGARRLTVPGLVKSTLWARLCRIWSLKRRTHTLWRYSGVICREDARTAGERPKTPPGTSWAPEISRALTTLPVRLADGILL